MAGSGYPLSVTAFMATGYHLIARVTELLFTDCWSCSRLHKFVLVDSQNTNSMGKIMENSDIKPLA